MSLKGEDRCFAEENVFAVFDGLGGHRNGGVAAEIAAKTFQSMSEMMPNNPPKTDDARSWSSVGISFAHIVSSVSRIVAKKTDGYTTCIATRIFEIGHECHAVWANMGDSRLYLCSGERVFQISEDETGPFGLMYNCMGRKPLIGYRKARQWGYLKIKRDEGILLCSDGVTGNRRGMPLTQDKIVSAINDSENAQEAADALVGMSREVDDRTAIVLRFVSR